MNILQQTCRICAEVVKSKKNLRNLFSSRCSPIRKQIEKIIGIRLSNTKNTLPQHICFQCLEDVKQVNAFRTRCLKIQIYFKSAVYQNALHEKFDSEETLVPDNLSAEILEFEENANKSVLEDENLNGKQIADVTDNENAFRNDEASRNCSDFDNDIDRNDVETLYSIETASMTDVEHINKQTDKHDSLDKGNQHDMEYDGNEARETISNQELENEYNDLETINGEEAGSEIESCEKIDKPNLKLWKKENVSEKANHFVCEKCGCYFDNSNHFITHLHRHQGYKPYECETCPSKFYTKSELKRHRRVHTGERPYACAYCDYSFGDHSSQIKHERTHTKERPYPCKTCGKRFPTQSGLKVHGVTHTGQRLHSCQLCNRDFQRHTHLVAHYRSLTHKQQVEKQQES